VYANLTLEIAALYTPNNVADFIKDAPSKRANVLPSFKIG
jgi:hypothetical protein